MQCELICSYVYGCFLCVDYYYYYYYYCTFSVVFIKLLKQVSLQFYVQCQETGEVSDKTCSRLTRVPFKTESHVVIPARWSFRAADGTCYALDTISDFVRQSRGWGCDQRANLHSACVLRFGARPHLITVVRYRVSLSSVKKCGRGTGRGVEFVPRIL